jgi:arginine utilization protein RocB
MKLEALKAWWKRAFCGHAHRDTKVTVTYGPFLHLTCVCPDCGADVKSDISFSRQWISHQMEKGKDLKPGEAMIVFGRGLGK